MRCTADRLINGGSTIPGATKPTPSLLVGGPKIPERTFHLDVCKNQKPKQTKKSNRNENLIDFKSKLIKFYLILFQYKLNYKNLKL